MRGRIKEFRTFTFKDEILSVGRQGEELLTEIRKKTEICVDRIGNISSIERLVKASSYSLNGFHQSINCNIRLT